MLTLVLPCPSNNITYDALTSQYCLSDSWFLEYSGLLACIIGRQLQDSCIIRPGGFIPTLSIKGSCRNFFFKMGLQAYV